MGVVAVSAARTPSASAQLSVLQVGRVFPAPRGRGTIEALQPIDLAVARNDFITILGPSGCGKSTLLRIIAGLDTPSPRRSAGST